MKEKSSIAIISFDFIKELMRMIIYKNQECKIYRIRYLVRNDKESSIQLFRNKAGRLFYNKNRYKPIK